MRTMAEATGVPVGYSDHTLGIIAAVVTCLVLLPLLHRATARKSGPQSPLETAP